MFADLCVPVFEVKLAFEGDLDYNISNDYCYIDWGLPGAVIIV